ncbi:MAG: transglycosylase SLT domain-containing protein [Myxococcales bacterium]|nr:transglycosylase SLT domain-containing protein [Myxococcales bacterium]
MNPVARCVLRWLRLTFLGFCVAFGLTLATYGEVQADGLRTPELFARARILFRLWYDQDAVVAIRMFRAQNKDEDWDLRAAYIEGAALVRLGQYSEAKNALVGFAPGSNLRELSNPLFALGQLQWAIAVSRGGAPADAVDLLRKSATRVHGRWVRVAKVDLARALTALQRWDEAKKAWLDVLRMQGRGVPKDEARAMLARIYGQIGQPAEAVGQWRHIAVNLPGSEFGAEALKHVPIRDLSAQQRYERAMNLWDVREYVDAVATFETLLDSPQYAHEAHHYIGRLLSERLRTNYERAAEHFGHAMGAGDPKVAGSSMFKLALVFGKLRQYDQAVRMLRDFQRKYPADSNAQEAGYEIGRHLMEAGRFREAGDYIAQWSATVPGDQAMFLWFAGWAYFRGGFYEDAIRIFDKLTSAQRTLVGDKAKYWKGKALVAQGKRDAAQALWRKVVSQYPFSYYAWLSELELGDGRGILETQTHDFSQIADRPANPWKPLVGAPRHVLLLVRDIRDLAEIGEIDEAKKQWPTVRSAVGKSIGSARLKVLDDNLDFVFERYKERRERLGGGGVHSKAPNPGNMVGWRHFFPRAFRDLAVVVSEKENVPEMQLYAHMLQESRYGPEMISGAKAFGLIQILRSTARRISRDIGVEYDPELLFDPGYNLRLGGAYLAALTRRFHGQLPLGMAAYNGGPLLLSFHMKQYPGLTLPESIESLPTHQSRNYARKVVEHMHRYLALYESPQNRKKVMEMGVRQELNYSELSTPDY